MNNAQNKYDLYEILRIEYELMIMSNHPMKEQIEIELKKLNEQVMPQYLSKYVLPYFNELLANYSPKYLCFTKDAHPELDDKEIVIKNTGITNCYLWVTHIVSNLLKVNRRENMSPVILKGETGLQEYYISSNADSKLTFSEFVNWFDNNAQKNGWKDYTNLGYDKLVSDWDNQLYVAFFRNREDGHSFMLRKVKNDKGEFVLMKATFDGALPKGEHFAPVDKEEFERMCDTVDLHIYGCPIV